MMRLKQLGYGFLCNILLVASALAGASGSPPAGDQGSGASEPSTYALIMLCAIPGVFLIRRALRSANAEE